MTGSNPGLTSPDPGRTGLLLTATYRYLRTRAGLALNRMGMSYPTWQLMLGGVGTPKMQKMLIPVDAKLPFEQVMAVMHYVESKVAKPPASWWWCLRGLSFSATSRLRLPPLWPASANQPLGPRWPAK